MNNKHMHLAGGCFWGMERYLRAIHGVIETEVGYANGQTEHPTYEQVCHEHTGHAETVRVVYDADRISLAFLLELYYRAIDPTAVNRQGGDCGVQYRTGIYWTDPADEPLIRRSVAELANRIGKPVAVEVEPLAGFWPAEEYHQRYLEKNPGGYCHIGDGAVHCAAQSIVDPTQYESVPREQLRERLTPVQFAVTQDNATEPAFQNPYWNCDRPGLYVDVTTGEPLFFSSDQFNAGCGWPSFTRPADPDVIRTYTDASHGMNRTEVRSRVGNVHLGHVFDDGPVEQGGLRYCINSAALRFIPREEMEQAGYGYLLPFVIL